MEGHGTRNGLPTISGMGPWSLQTNKNGPSGDTPHNAANRSRAPRNLPRLHISRAGGAELARATACGVDHTVVDMYGLYHRYFSGIAAAQRL
jgi:hypothetical protein